MDPKLLKAFQNFQFFDRRSFQCLNNDMSWKAYYKQKKIIPNISRCKTIISVTFLICHIGTYDNIMTANKIVHTRICFFQTDQNRIEKRFRSQQEWIKLALTI